ncbi:hypothetical protein FRB96_002338 [Tulasnella sp. 330]|nr:hypothetical protein FRB96_002338 [Tulasnella sp. 330]KAG8876581.1 hypothetical protein FRB97_004091 [Tulasnella sp. 331]
MTVIWGLDLKEMQWSKFRSSYMFNRTYHLRRTKMIVYQIAMILCVCSESVGTAALSDYAGQQQYVAGVNGATIYNNDFIGIASYNIFVGIAVATIFGAAFFFDLFWPERHESPAVKISWKISAVVVTIMAFADAIALTVIVATRGAYLKGVSATEESAILQAHHYTPPLEYRRNGRAVASVVLLWPGLIATIASTFILFASYKHNEKYGPKSHYGRKEEQLGGPHSGDESPEMRSASVPTNGAQPNDVRNV